MRTFRNYCISHEPPLLPGRFLDAIVGLGTYRPDRGVHISQVDPYWDAQRPIAFGAAGTYVMPRVIADNGDRTDQTGLCSFRKMVVRSPIGREAAIYPGMREASAQEMSTLTPDDIRPRDGFDFLISQPRTLPLGIIGQYAHAHNAIDLLDYLSLAVKLSVLSASELRDFALEPFFIPGGCEFGVFPTPWVTQALSKLELVGREFLSQHGDRVRGYDAYQVRAVGFLSERLGSFFLMQELRRRYPQGAPGEILGYMCTVVVEGQPYVPGIASGQEMAEQSIPWSR